MDNNEKVTFISDITKSHILNLDPDEAWALVSTKLRPYGFVKRYGQDITLETIFDNIATLFKFAHSAPSLQRFDALALAMSDLFMIRGEATFNEYGDQMQRYWTITEGPWKDWHKLATSNELISPFLEYVRDPQRHAYVNQHRLMLGWMIMSDFIEDLSAYADIFIDAPPVVEFSPPRKKKHAQLMPTEVDHVEAIERSPYLHQLKKRTYEMLEDLPDPFGDYNCLALRVIDKGMFSAIFDSQDTKYRQISNAVATQYSHALLLRPTAFDSEGNQRVNWHPWSYPYSQFIRIANRDNLTINIVTPGQVQWRSTQAQQRVMWSCMRNIIPEQYQWHTGLLKGWRETPEFPAVKQLLKNWGKCVNG